MLNRETHPSFCRKKRKKFSHGCTTREAFVLGHFIFRPDRHDALCGVQSAECGICG